MNDDCKYYGFEDSERLYQDPDELLEAVLEYCDDITSVSKTAVVYEYVRARPEPDVDRILEDIYERLDEEYGDPEGDYTDIGKLPEEVVCAARLLANAVRRNYRSWLCVRTGTKFEVDQHEFFRSRWPEEADKLRETK